MTGNPAVDGEIHLAIATKTEDEIMILLTIDGKSYRYRISPHVAASFIGRLASALAE